LPAHNPGPLAGTGNNTYLVLSGGEAALVDAGVGDLRHLERIQHELTARRARLRDVLVTHAHSDHASGAAALHLAHPLAHFHKYPWPQEDRKFDVPWRFLRDGETCLGGNSALVSLHTPGHSPDHIAFWHEASGTVFSGDLVIAGASVMIHTSGGGDLHQYLASLTRIRELKPRRLLPSHGAEVTDPDTLLAQYIAHRQQREQQVLAALARGHRTVESITESIYHGLEPRLVPAARENVLAHLQKLRREGRAFEEESSHTWTTLSISST
jgi:glyoxylase-like metal-dependent hydrolase (beta-lactamase superfamily II)